MANINANEIERQAGRLDTQNVTFTKKVKDVINNLDNQVKNEPYIALDGGKDGLDFYKKIINESYAYLKCNGYLCLEIGFDQKIDVIELIENTTQFKETYSKKDLYDNDRIIITQIK